MKELTTRRTPLNTLDELIRKHEKNCVACIVVKEHSPAKNFNVIPCHYVKAIEDVRERVFGMIKDFEQIKSSESSLIVLALKELAGEQE